MTILVLTSACATTRDAPEERAPASTSKDPSWLRSPELSHLQLSAPLQKIFKEKKNSDEAPAEAPGVLSYFDSTVTGGKRRIPVKVKVRGHTNFMEGECTFPKLTLKFKAADVVHTPFEGLEKIKLGTHCGDQPLTAEPAKLFTPKNRILNQLGIVREAFAYELLRTFGVITLSSRLIDMSYQDTSGAGASRSITRKAMLLDDEEELAKRLNARALKYTESTPDGPADPKLPVFRNAQEEGLLASQVAEVLLSEALLGNHDFFLVTSRNDHTGDGGPGLYNAQVLENVSNHHKTVIPYDFDIASSINGRNAISAALDSYDLGIFRNMTPVQYFILLRVQTARALLSKAATSQARAKFTSAREKAYSALNAFPLDATGRVNFKEHLDYFFEAIGNSYELPVILESKGVLAYHDAGQKELCGRLPRGTVIQKIQERDLMVQVHILSPLPSAEDDACEMKGPFWISRTSTAGVR